MRASYNDPEAVVGCEDGTACLFDMYSRKCSQIIRMRAGPVTCLCLSDDQLILVVPLLGASQSRVVYLISSSNTKIKNNNRRTMRSLWETRVSPNVVLQHLRSDKSTLVVGGIDGVLRTLFKTQVNH